MVLSKVPDSNNPDAKFIHVFQYFIRIRHSGTLIAQGPRAKEGTNSSLPPAYNRAMPEEKLFTCPICGHDCRTTAILCPECGVQFEYWLRDNPGRTLPGWESPASRTSVKPPATPEAPNPGKEMTPEAKAALAIMQMENEERLKHSPGAKAAKKAGRLMLAVAFWGLASGIGMKVLGMGDFGNPITLLCLLDAIVLTPLSIGVFRGKRKWAFYGAGYYILSSVLTIILPGNNSNAFPDLDLGPVMAVSGLTGNAILAFFMFRNAMRMEE